MGIAVQRLSVERRCPARELPQEVDVVRGLERGQHRHEIGGMARRRQRPVVVGEPLVNRPQQSAGESRVDLTLRLHVAPEGHDPAVAAVRPWIELVRGWDHCGAGSRRMGRDGELAHEVLGMRPLGVGDCRRHARDDRRWAQVDEHVPRIAQDDRLLAAQAVLRSHGERRGDCARSQARRA
jgi:hypothetical protein